jgi:hypothetical protein
MRVAFLLAVVGLSGLAASAPSFPLPFRRALSVQTPALTGSDVATLQALLAARAGCAAPPPQTFAFDAATSACLASFQQSQGVGAHAGVLDPATAQAVLTVLGLDSYKDDGRAPRETGHLYKVHIILPSSNRSVEATARLLDADGAEIFNFTARLHGASVLPPPAWPNYNSSGSGMNEFTGDGATPTGLAEFDLNSPESDPLSFGPYPVNRAVSGLAGNWQLVSRNDDTTLRSGILLHTGEWPAPWAPPQPMPNSLGCIHAWPASIERVWHELVARGVEVRNNTNGVLPYPYKSQGLLSIECVGDDCIVQPPY